MASLTGRLPSATYKGILQIDNNQNGIDATCRNVEDGEGTSSPLALATNKVCIESGTFEITSGVTIIIPGVTNSSGTTVYNVTGTTITVGITGATFNFCAATSVTFPDTFWCSGATVDFTNATVTGLTFTTISATTILARS